MRRRRAIAERFGQPLRRSGVLEITCDHCGRSRRWTREHLEARGIPETVSINDLGSRLFCSACRAAGAPGIDISIRQIPTG